MLNVSPSLSSRRAWIEIKYTDDTAANAAVALLAEGVDRNVVLLHCDCFA